MIKLLLVDDQSIILQGLKAILSLESDLEIIGIAENGEEAITQVETLKPDVILMDVRMPVMNGSTATRIICERFPASKVLILSTFDNDDDVEEAIQAGAKGYLLKDMPACELVDAIRCIHRGYTQLAPGVLEKVVTQKLRASNLPQSMNSTLSILTPRELDVARLVAMGATNQEIADKLFISTSTVKTHINSIFHRLNLKNRAQLAIHAALSEEKQLTSSSM